MWIFQGLMDAIRPRYLLHILSLLVVEKVCINLLTLLTIPEVLCPYRFDHLFKDLELFEILFCCLVLFDLRKIAPEDVPSFLFLIKHAISPKV